MIRDHITFGGGSRKFRLTIHTYHTGVSRGVTLSHEDGDEDARPYWREIGRWERGTAGEAETLIANALTDLVTIVDEATER